MYCILYVCYTTTTTTIYIYIHFLNLLFLTFPPLILLFNLFLYRFYKNNAIDFSRLQISIDTFLFSGQYTDVATLAVLSKYTAGSTYFYPAYNSTRDGE